MRSVAAPYVPSPAWRASLDDGILVVSAGADVVLAEEGLDAESARLLVEGWGQGAIDVGTLSQHAQETVQALVAAGAVARTHAPVPTTTTIGVRFAGMRDPPLERRLLQEIDASATLRPVAGDPELVLVVRTTARLVELYEPSGPEHTSRTCSSTSPTTTRSRSARSSSRARPPASAAWQVGSAPSGAMRRRRRDPQSSRAPRSRPRSRSASSKRSARAISGWRTPRSPTTSRHIASLHVPRIGSPGARSAATARRLRGATSSSPGHAPREPPRDAVRLAAGACDGGDAHMLLLLLLLLLRGDDHRDAPPTRQRARRPSTGRRRPRRRSASAGGRPGPGSSASPPCRWRSERSRPSA